MTRGTDGTGTLGTGDITTRGTTVRGTRDIMTLGTETLGIGADRGIWTLGTTIITTTLSMSRPGTLFTGTGTALG